MKIHFLFLASTKGEDRVKSQFLTKFEGITVTISKIVIWQSLFTEQLKHKIVNWATCKTPSENPCQQYVHWLKSFATKASLKNMLICRHSTGSTRKVWVKIFFLMLIPPPFKKKSSASFLSCSYCFDFSYPLSSAQVSYPLSSAQVSLESATLGRCKANAAGISNTNTKKIFKYEMSFKVGLSPSKQIYFCLLQWKPF